MAELVDAHAEGWIDEEGSFETLPPSPDRDGIADDDEEFVIVRRGPWGALLFGALGVGLLAGALGLVAVSVATPSEPSAVQGIAAAEPVARPIAPIEPAPPPPAIDGEGQRKPRRTVVRAGAPTSRPPPLAVGALPAMSVSALPPAQ